jgi:hypothetical protein
MVYFNNSILIFTLRQTVFIFFIITLLSSCFSNQQKRSTVISHNTISPNLHDDALLPPNIVNSNNYNFFADSLLHGHRDILEYYFKKYLPDSCQHFHSEKKELINNFEGLVYLGDINHNHTKDSVFVLEPISYCKFEGEEDFEGDAYYFTDTTLPRLQTSSVCCHPNNIFNAGDIDEDGISEIGQFFSSCASHYKSLRIYSLKNNQWKEIGHSVFDLHYMDIEKPFSFWVRKTAKNKFEMLQITDLTEKAKVGKKDWLKFSM